MSSILRKIRGVKRRTEAAFDQRKTPVTVANLTACQFENKGFTHHMGDLTIWNIGSLFYYRSKRNKLTEIKSMFTVAQLVYGKIAYGR